MNSRKDCGRCGIVAFISLGLLVVVGCGGDDLGKRYPVSGTVTYKGAPVKQGTITFSPEKPYSEKDPTTRASVGTIQDGKYTLTTNRENDGAFPGKYKVLVVAKETDNSKVLANAKGGAGRQDDVFKANQNAKSLVPKKYSDPLTTTISAEVKAASNKIDFPLTD